MAGKSLVSTARILILALLVAGCSGTASSSLATSARLSAGASPPVVLRGSDAGTQGEVRFASERVGWVVASRPRAKSTVIYRTGDGGATWRLWSVVSGAGRVAAVGESEVFLTFVNSSREPYQLRHSSNGSGWEILQLPEHALLFALLPDLRHGFLDTVPANSHAAYWLTEDGGRTWRAAGSVSDWVIAAEPQFWNRTSGFYSNWEQCGPQGGSPEECVNTFYVTHDAGTTWAPVNLSLPKTSIEPRHLEPNLPTMFDDLRGVMPIYILPTNGEFQGPELYVSSTADAGDHWSTPRKVTMPEPANLLFVDQTNWIATGSMVFSSGDGGVTWQEAHDQRGSLAVDAGFFRIAHVSQTSRNVVFLTSDWKDVEWAEISTDSGRGWRPVPLPDLRVT